MLDFAMWVESTRISKALFGISWLWPACESLHFIGLCMLIGGAGLLDLRLMGMFRGLAIRHVKAMMPWAIGGFLLNATTGMLFLIMQPHLYLSSVVWWSKVAFIVVAAANALFFETRLALPALAMDPAADTPRAMKVVGACSLFSWFAVLYCGRMLPYLGTGN
jgi:hypothetical protein